MLVIVFKFKCFLSIVIFIKSKVADGVIKYCIKMKCTLFYRLWLVILLVNPHKIVAKESMLYQVCFHIIVYLYQILAKIFFFLSLMSYRIEPFKFF